jgi:hypothetical protein
VVAKAPAAAQATAPAAGAAAPPTARAAKPAPAEPEANAGWNDAEEAAAEQASSRWVAKSAKSAEPPARAADPKAGVRRQADEGRTSGNETVAALVERAEKLIAAQRWHDAAAIYQDLLRRHPQHPDAPAWRRKLAVAEAERARFAAPPPAKAAEKAAKARKTAPAADSPAY